MRPAAATTVQRRGHPLHAPLQRPKSSDPAGILRTMPGLTVASVNVDALDPERLAAFWAAATGGAVTGRHEDFVFVSPPQEGGVMLFFQRVAHKEPGRNTLHLDLGVPDGQRAAEVERLVGLGATRQWEVEGEVSWVDWTTMTDPEGNLFCVGAPPVKG
jgi:hypothetical protein